MIRLAHIVETYATELIAQDGHRLLPSQLAALNAFQLCRSSMSPRMELACDGCTEQSYLPHSCGHRSCPHCQAHESQRWIDQQLQKLVPGNYFMVTFTLPAQFRALAWQHQRVMYDLITRSAWETVNTFSQNDRKLRGTAGAVTVLHTHSRRLDYHPHVHLVMPGAAFDNKQRRWRNKEGGYLFDHKALAKVFRAKMLAGIKQAGLKLPDAYSTEWVVDCKAVGSGQQALVYLGRYLYRGVIQEKDILSCKHGRVTFRYRNSQTKQTETRTLSAVAFLHLILQHILPKGYRRARNFGFLHPNSKLIPLVQLRKRVVLPPPQPRPAIRCKCCGGMMKIIRTRIKTFIKRLRTPAADRETAM
ncbi:MAG: IS91 family transposase [Gallionella sp.]|nr:IS91 family transposase [Gallionella sp.]